MTNKLKKLVSKNKRRFETEGFNLDLSYVTEQVIAMGFPSERVESVFRNSLEDVRRYQSGAAWRNIGQKWTSSSHETIVHGV